MGERLLRSASEVAVHDDLSRAPRTAMGPRIRATVPLPLWVGDELVRARVVSFEGLLDAGEHVAVVFGASPLGRVPLVRIHSECLTGDVLGSARCDCGPQLNQALSVLSVEGGVVLYLRQEGRGVGLYNKIDAYALQDQGLDTYDANLALQLPADQRDFTVAAQMLMALGTIQCELLTNNPEKCRQLVAAGIDVTGVRGTGAYVTTFNREYLETKVRRAGHAINLLDERLGEPS